MKTLVKASVLLAMGGLGLACVGCCSPREAATMGAVIARPFGYALGISAVAVGETFETAADVVEANPRYASDPVPARTATGWSRPNAGEPHYYETRVMVKTAGQARIERVDLIESRESAAFWR